MKLTKAELNMFRKIYKKYTGKEISAELSEDAFLHFIRLMYSLKK